MTAPPIAPAGLRNAAAILGVLRYELAHCKSVLEIGSGTGQHAVAFAPALPGLTWQTSDLSNNLAGINAHIDVCGAQNLLRPVELDVRVASIEPATFDAVFTANTMHIMSFDAVGDMVGLAASLLPVNGVFCVYGPFRTGGTFSTDSNAAFHATLRATNSDQGIRDLEGIDEIASLGLLRRVRSYAMPANNLLLVWQKTGETFS